MEFRLILASYDKVWVKSDDAVEVQFSNGTDAWSISKEKVEKYTSENRPQFQNTMLGYSRVNVPEKSILQVVVNKAILSGSSNSTPEAQEKLVLKFLRTFVFHEGFHYFIQNSEKGWVEGAKDTVRFPRATTYPLQSNPRIYRNHIFKLLIKAYSSEEMRARYLRDAAFWFNKYKTEFPAELEQIRSTDRIEGTARYAENASLVAINHGFDAKSKDMAAFLATTYGDLPYLDTLSQEAYELGYVAGLHLDMINKCWKNEIHHHEISPLEILFRDIMPSDVEPRMEGDYAAKITETIEAENADLQASMALFKRVVNGENVGNLLFLPSSAGSFRAGAFYKHSELDRSFTYLKDFVQTFENGKDVVKINKASVFDMPGKNDCAYKGNFYVLMESGSPQNIELGMETRETKNESGQTVLCLTAFEK
ncbi:MAG: hypothetical protein R2684_15530 [Pyrinomonadaceae bacterium]